MWLWSFFFLLRIISIPNSGIIEVAFWNHDNTENGGNIESWPLANHFVEHRFFIKIFISTIFQFYLYWNSPDVPDGLRLISIVVGLNQKPILIAKFIQCMHSLYFSLNHCALTKTWNDVVYRCTYLNSFQSLQSWLVCRLFFQNFSE